jgi:6-phosphogluconolactonase/glucosamine-6-phosphate isomerase/deaminase
VKQVRVFADLEAASESASGLILESVREAIAAGRDAVVALSGGETPRETYRVLGRVILEQAIPVAEQP